VQLLKFSLGESRNKLVHKIDEVFKKQALHTIEGYNNLEIHYARNYHVSFKKKTFT
jgi:hypothetical protein